MTEMRAGGEPEVLWRPDPDRVAASRMTAFRSRVAEREGLDLRTFEGDMADLSRFPDESFDLVFNPTSVIFTPDARKVWREAARVLRPGGKLWTVYNNRLPHRAALRRLVGPTRVVDAGRQFTVTVSTRA